MSGMALKGQCNLVSKMPPPPEVSLKQSYYKKRKNNIYCSKVANNAVFAILYCTEKKAMMAGCVGFCLNERCLQRRTSVKYLKKEQGRRDL